jgi:hypothetical protein
MPQEYIEIRGARENNFGMLWNRMNSWDWIAFLLGDPDGHMILERKIGARRLP